MSPIGSRKKIGSCPAHHMKQNCNADLFGRAKSLGGAIKNMFFFRKRDIYSVKLWTHSKAYYGGPRFCVFHERVGARDNTFEVLGDNVFVTNRVQQNGSCPAHHLKRNCGADLFVRARSPEGTIRNMFFEQNVK